MSNYDPTTEGVADTDPTERPEDAAVQLTRDLVYGDVDESGPKLRNFIHNEAVAAVQGHALPYQASQETAGSPSSAKVGMSGARAKRISLVTA
jgi:hypothetical protein